MDLSRFSITGEQERVISLRLQNKRLIKLRWLYVTSLISIAAVSNFVAGHPDLGWRYLIIGAIAVAFNGLIFAINQWTAQKRLLQLIMIVQLLLDLAIASAATYMQGGYQSRTTVIYALPIVSAALIFSDLMVYLTAFIAGAGYILSVLAYNFAQHDPLHSSVLLVPLIFYPAFFMIFARLVVYLTRVTANETREHAYDSFLALLSHQLKHPASTANAIIDFMEHSPPKNAAEQKKYLNMLKSETQNLLLLLNNLLETAAVPHPLSKFDVVDLPKLLQQITYQCAEDHARPQDLKLTLHEMSLLVVGNSERLKTALMNVLNNAFQYSEPGSHVTVGMKTTGSNVILTIKDKGEGISKGTRRRLFQKYSLNEASREGVQGLGLGLFVSKKILTSFGGNLHVVTDKSGTSVIIMLKRGKHE